MERFLDEIWVMCLEIVANTLTKCQSRDNNREARLGEAVKKYPPPLIVCQKFYSFCTHCVHVAGKLLAIELLDLAEQSCFLLLTNYPQS